MKRTKRRATSASITIRTAIAADAGAMAELSQRCYADLPRDPHADAASFARQIAVFPEGQLVAERDGTVVGYASSLIVQLDAESPWHLHDEISANRSFSTHDPSGDTLYGVDIAVDPDVRRHGAARHLYQARLSLMRTRNLRRFLASGRIPGHAAWKGRLSAEAYIAKVAAGTISDPILGLHLAVGGRVDGLHYGFLEETRSLGYATRVVIDNAGYRADRGRERPLPIRQRGRRVRVCATQYDQRRIATWRDFADQIAYFAETAETYESHVLVFPEYVTAQLFSTYPRKLGLLKAVGRLAASEARFHKLFGDLARKHRLYIVGGTTPVRGKDGLRNVAHLYTPSGGIHTQEKLHITPSEVEHWGIQPGQGLKVFNTPFGRMAIVICYDMEFPELARLLVEAGVDIILNPFATDERKSYLRVRYCAQARAVENMVYVVMSGNVGGLANSPSMYLNFGQAAICTPSDFAFPMNGIAAEGVVNTQTVVVADLDLATLELQRRSASVRPLIDRRDDLYDLRARVPVEHIDVD